MQVVFGLLVLVLAIVAGCAAQWLRDLIKEKNDWRDMYARADRELTELKAAAPKEKTVYLLGDRPPPTRSKAFCIGKGVELKDVKVVHCPRCGGSHAELSFSKIRGNSPSSEYLYWAMCPLVKEPVLVQSVVLVEGEQCITPVPVAGTPCAPCLGAGVKG